MTKKEYIELVAAEASISKKDVEKVLSVSLDTIKKAVKEGDKVSFQGFGSFEQGFRKERQGVNPATGEKVTIAAAKTVKFKASKAFKDEVK